MGGRGDNGEDRELQGRREHERRSEFRLPLARSRRSARFSRFISPDYGAEVGPW